MASKEQAETSCPWKLTFFEPLFEPIGFLMQHQHL